MRINILFCFCFIRCNTLALCVSHIILFHFALRHIERFSIYFNPGKIYSKILLTIKYVKTKRSSDGTILSNLLMNFATYDAFVCSNSIVFFPTDLLPERSC